MSEASQISPRRGVSLEIVLSAAAILVVVLGLSYFASTKQQDIRHSPSGFDGLVQWLNGQSIPSRSFSGGYRIDPDAIGILIVPIFDTDLLKRRTLPTTKQELLFQSDEYDLGLSTVLRKREALKTVIVLPKWRSGMRLAGLAHPALLNDGRAAQNTLGVVSSGVGQSLKVIPSPFSKFSYRARDGSELTAQSYVSRVFSGPACDPIIGTPDAMVLGECKFKDQRPFFILSDPDIFNNHGLRLGDNAAIATDFFGQESGDDLVLVDTSNEFRFFGVEKFTRPERTWADLTQFFAYPFALLWLGGAALLFTSVWRAGIRFGPIRYEQFAPGAAKTLAINARARLLRRSGKNAAMLSHYADARLGVLLSGLFGPALAENKPAALRRLSRHAPDPAARLTDLLNDLETRTDTITSQEAIAFVDEFETLMSEIENDT